MRIAQVAPLYESVPPQLYGGTERVVSWLTEELVDQGHEVTLFASGDSQTRAELVPVCPRALRLDSNRPDPLIWHQLMLGQVAAQAHRFDVVHFHCDFLHFPLSRAMGLRQLTTLHGRLDLPELQPLYDEFRDMPVVSISDNQRLPLPQARWQTTVYHGLPADTYRPGPGDGGYLAFLGRISPEKRADRAIEIAARARMPIKIAAKVDPADRVYFEERIEPLLGQGHVEFVGEIGEQDKQEFLGNAAALLFPIDWPEPFGLVMIEAMACGTPVIALPCGSVPEVLDHGVTGFVCNDIQEAAEAVARCRELDRTGVRAVFDERFVARRMALDYLRAYENLLAQPSTHDRDHAERVRVLHPGQPAPAAPRASGAEARRDVRSIRPVG